MDKVYIVAALESSFGYNRDTKKYFIEDNKNEVTIELDEVFVLEMVRCMNAIEEIGKR